MTPHQRARAVVNEWLEKPHGYGSLTAESVVALRDAIAAALEEERDTTIEACANVVESFARAISTDATVDCRTDMLYNSRISEIATKVRQRKGAR